MKMEDNVVNQAAVFSPTIKRTNFVIKNNLYDLLNIDPAKPIITVVDYEVKCHCKFYPRTDKFYIPKKKSGLKVKTARDIKKTFEEDTYTYLPRELDLQQNVLLKKIRCGSSRNESTKTVARKILKLETPISRNTWQMLVNINPEQYSHPKQFVMWNGNNIQVNGSKGGNDKYICKFDLAHKEVLLKNTNSFKNKLRSKNRALLQNSLDIKFKPGPLKKKGILDDSHQKYHVGNIELVKLPKPGLVIHPTFGTSLEPTISNFLNKLQNDDGTISQEWAQLTVSILGTIQKSGPVQINKEFVTFDLNYKCDQHRILMRRDIYDMPKSIKNERVQVNLPQDEDLLVVIENMLKKMLDCVEISLNQNNMFTEEDECQQVTSNEIKEDHALNREKLKRKHCELDRLDVTVIRLPEEPKNEISIKCDKPFCSLGCVCDSIDRVFCFRGHCGLVDCMFTCKCDFSRYTAKDSLNINCPELIPELLKLNHSNHSKLAREEKKFRQTVILTGDQSILLKSQRRNAKVPKKYADFYKNLSYKNRENYNLSITVMKVDCKNVEPWCMIHNLYRCFCKGKFIETYIDKENDIKESMANDMICNSNEKSRRTSNDSKVVELYTYNNSNTNSANIYVDISTCARVKAYTGRKYSDTYYKKTNKKILDMEENDSKLHHKMIRIIYQTDKRTDPKQRKVANSDRKVDKSANSDDPSTSTSTNLDQFLSGVDEIIEKHGTNCEIQSKTNDFSNKSKLVRWLETNYKVYKDRVDRGLTMFSLKPPKIGKVALYPWSFILSRYRERKNFFLISKCKPFRIFMAVNCTNPLFNNCININDIRFADLNNYPVTVKNLLTNATDLKDNFCILSGLSDCWELIGSVSKISEEHENSGISETVDTEYKEMFDINPTWGDKQSLENRLNDKHSLEITAENDKQSTFGNKEIKLTEIETSDDLQISENVKQSDGSPTTTHYQDKISSFDTLDNIDTSKWFVMTLENDFSEIRFYKRGFFVKYDSIVKAINVARMSGKTVRLSSQKCMDKNIGPQFGIYAIPNAYEYCVFVGPYEIKDSLGIETVKTILSAKNLKRTRGFWIITNKLDNLKVIDNPLPFINTLQNRVNVPLDLNLEASSETELENPEIDLHKSDKRNINIPSTSKDKIANLQKPIKISKNNRFFHLDSNGLFKKSLSKSPIEKNKLKSILVKHHGSIAKDMADKILKMPNAPYKIISKSPPQSSEVSPIKISSACSVLKNEDVSTKNKSEKGMFILKPEEINKKLIENKLFSTNSPESKTDRCLSLDQARPLENVDQMSIDSSLYDTSNVDIDDADIYLVSDGENCTTNNEKEGCPREVWIKCINQDVGWIRGKRNLNNNISIKMSENHYSEFLPEKDAFEKINRTMCFSSPSADFRWKVVESADELTGCEIKFWVSDHLQNMQRESKTYSRTKINHLDPALETETICDSSRDTSPPFGGVTQEDLPYTVSDNSSEFINSIINVPDKMKHTMTETLKRILSMSQSLNED